MPPWMDVMNSSVLTSGLDLEVLIYNLVLVDLDCSWVSVFGGGSDQKGISLLPKSQNVLVDKP